MEGNNEPVVSTLLHALMEKKKTELPGVKLQKSKTVKNGENQHIHRVWL